VATLGLLVLTAIAGIACSANPIAPTPVSPVAAPASQAILTVRVFTRTSEAPIEGAVVTALDRSSRTDAAGTCVFSISSGQMVDVDVSAAGYLPMGASAVVGNGEHWTFYLETN